MAVPGDVGVLRDDEGEGLGAPPAAKHWTLPVNLQSREQLNTASNSNLLKTRYDIDVTITRVCDLESNYKLVQSASMPVCHCLLSPHMPWEGSSETAGGENFQLNLLLSLIIRSHCSF